MTWRVVFEAAAQAEIVESFEWYEEKSYGLGGEFLRVIAAAEEQLARSPGVAGQAALEALSNMPGATASAQKVALEQLAKGGARAGPAMAILSRDSSDEGRAALIKAARGGDPNLSAQALGLLGQRRDAESLLTLSELASHGSTPAQRAAALSALSQSGHPSALAHLQAGLKDESPEVRAQAVQALSESSDPKLETSLLTASVDKDPNVVNAATSALAQLGTPPALARLEEIASSGDGQLTPQALHALAHAAPERAAKFAETLATSSDPQTCLAAAQISMMFPKPVATRILSSAFRNADPNVLRESASYLAQLGLSRRELTAILAPLWQNPHLPEDLRITLNEIINSAGN